MMESNEPNSREELIAAFDIVHRQSAELFESASPEAFFQRPSQEVWSPGENVIHLIKSVKAVADAMKMPKLVLRGLFGTARGSSSYAQVRERYLQALADGGVASGRFVPSVSPPAGDADPSRDRALSGWRRAGDSLVEVVGKWPESALDKYRMPHPLLGKLSVREMLCFTHYHDLHHIETVRRILNN